MVLHYLVGLSPAEAARQLGISRVAFDTRLSRGREALRRELTLLMDETKQQVEVYLAGISERVKATLKLEQRERVTAAKELALLAARANLPRLFRDLKGPDEGVRKLAAQLLGETLDPRAVAPLTEALPAEENAAVQAEAAWSLSLISPTDLTGEIMTQLHAVLEAAAMGRPGPWWVTFPALGAPTDRAKIASLLLRSDIRWKGPITEAVLLMSRPGETEGNATVLEALQTNVDPKCRWKLVKALGLTVDPTVTGAFQKFLSDREPKVREEAARAIAGYPEGQDLLKTAMTESADEGLITAAAPFVDDPAFLEELSVRLTPKSRITVQAAAAKQKARR